MNWIKKPHRQILIGLTLGFIWRILAPLFSLQAFTTDYFKPVETIFILLLQMVAIPSVPGSYAGEIA